MARRTMASTTGTARPQIVGSRRVMGDRMVSSMVAMLTVFCGIEMVEVGLTATRPRISSPFEIPPRMPPAWFVSNVTRPFSSRPIRSLSSEPLRLADSKPSPISQPFTDGMLITAYAMRALSLSNTGSPTPGGTPTARNSRMPPQVSPSSLISRVRSIIVFAASRSGQRMGVCSMWALISSRLIALAVLGMPSSSLTYATTSMWSRARIFLARAPAATRAAVSRPLARPAPFQSVWGPNL